MNYLQDLQRDAISMQFGKQHEDNFFKKVKNYVPAIYHSILLHGYPNAKNRLETFLYSLGQCRIFLRDSRTFIDGKKKIMKLIIDLQKELEQ